MEWMNIKPIYKEIKTDLSRPLPLVSLISRPVFFLLLLSSEVVTEDFLSVWAITLRFQQQHTEVSNVGLN